MIPEPSAESKIPRPLRQILARIQERNAHGDHVDLDAQINDWAEYVDDPHFASLSGFLRAVALGDMSVDYLRRFYRDGRFDDLDRAESLLRTVAADLDDDASVGSRYLVNLAGARLAANTTEGLDEAIDILSRVVDSTPADSQVLTSRLEHLLKALSKRYADTSSDRDLERISTLSYGLFQRTLEREHLARAIKASIKLRDEAIDSALRRDARLRIPLWTYSAYERTGHGPHADEAIECLEDICDHPDDVEQHEIALSNLIAYMGRVGRERGDLAMFDRALKLAREQYGRGWEPTALSIATLLIDRDDTSGSYEHLDEAIDHIRDALAESDDPVHNSAAKLNLASAMRIKGMRDRRPALLNEAIEVYEVLLDIGDSPRVELYQNFANALKQRYHLTHDPSDLIRARDLAQQAAEWIHPDSPGYARVVANAARMGGAVSSELQQSADLSAALQGLAAATRQGASRSAVSTLWAGVSWGALARQLGRLDEAVEAYELAASALDEILTRQAVLRDLTAMIGRGQGVNTALALVHIERRDPAAAVAAIENGRRQLFARRLDLVGVDIARLEAKGHGSLADELRSAVLRSLDADASFNEGPTRQGVLSRIRALPGFEDFLIAGPMDDAIAAVTDEADVLYLVPGRDGGAGLWHGPNASSTTVRLPEFTTALCWELRRSLLNLESAPAAVQSMGPVLWSTVMGPLLAQRPSQRPMVVVAAGVSSDLPYHAACTKDTDSPGGLRYVLDEGVVSYAPSIRSYAHVLTLDNAADSLLAVVDPQPVSLDPVSGAERETRVALRLFRRHHALIGPEARLAAVLRAIEDYDAVHFSCHGRAVPDNPLAGHLVLAYDEELTVADLVDSDASARLAVLAACESGISGAEDIDEVVSFPAALLHAGFKGVVGSLWSIPDDATADLLTLFYEHWRVEDESPAAALRSAQLSLRCSARGELRDPWAWAGLCITGA